MKRWRLPLTNGRTLLVYATDRDSAFYKSADYGVLKMSAVEYAGWYDRATNQIVDDTERVEIVGDVYARPQSKKPREPLIVHVPTALSLVTDRSTRETLLKTKNGAHR